MTRNSYRPRAQSGIRWSAQVARQSVLCLSLGLGLSAHAQLPAPSITAPTTDCPITAAPAEAGSATPEESFAAWRAEFERAAVACGVSPGNASVALQSARLDPSIARLDRRQAEFNSTFMGYLQRRVSDGMVQQGRSRLQSHATLLQALKARYGVAPEILVALWGLESGYGANIGDTPVLSALATLAYEGRRRDFYQQQLLSALRLLDDGDVDIGQLRGSWAGAMGQVQFMPGTFITYAMDGDDDGRRDLWASTADALTSAANYLAGIGWRPGQPWGVEVTLPPGFDPYSAELNVRRPTADWAAEGLRLAAGGTLSDALGQLPTSGAVVLPSGVQGPTFLVFDNFDAILEWNRSIFYALSVGYLSQRLAGGPALVGRAPPGERALSRAEVMGLQASLNTLGLDAGNPDGMVGAQTRQALRSYQAQHQLTADAYPTPELIARIRVQAGGEAPAGVTAGLDQTSILALQRGLHQLGYNPGPVDGLMGAQTRSALHEYLSDRGQPAVDRPDQSLVEQVSREGAAVPR